MKNMCETCGNHETHRDDAMNRRCNGCEYKVRQCICKIVFYTLAKVHIETGMRIVLYAHATATVVTEFWEAYTTDEFKVEISIFDPKSGDCKACKH